MIKRFISAEKGDSIITGLYTMLLLTIIFFIGIDIVGYASTSWKLRNSCREALTLMKIENGFDRKTELFFYNIAQSNGLDASRLYVTGTPKPKQRGDVLTIRATIPYDLHSIRPFNRQLTVDVDYEASGLAQDLVR